MALAVTYTIYIFPVAQVFGAINTFSEFIFYFSTGKYLKNISVLEKSEMMNSGSI